MFIARVSKGLLRCTMPDAYFRPIVWSAFFTPGALIQDTAFGYSLHHAFDEKLSRFHATEAHKKFY
jgi:hypothetical protein